MENNGGNMFDRRAVLKTSAMALGGLVLAGERTEALPRAVNTNSGPSKLKITDLRVATVVKTRPKSLSPYSHRYRPRCLRPRRSPGRSKRDLRIVPEKPHSR